jgi:hypothetical protein
MNASVRRPAFLHRLEIALARSPITALLGPRQWALPSNSSLPDDSDGCPIIRGDATRLFAAERKCAFPMGFGISLDGAR